MMVLNENKINTISTTENNVELLLNNAEKLPAVFFIVSALKTFVSNTVAAKQNPNEGIYANLSAIVDSMRKKMFDTKEIVIRKNKIPKAIKFFCLNVFNAYIKRER